MDPERGDKSDGCDRGERDGGVTGYQLGGRGYGGVLCSIKSNSAEKICLQLKSSCELYFN